MTGELRLLRVSEVAALLGCGRSTVYALIARGDLRPVDLGLSRKPMTRLRSDDVAALIESRTR